MARARRLLLPSSSTQSPFSSLLTFRSPAVRHLHLLLFYEKKKKKKKTRLHLVLVIYGKHLHLVLLIQVLWKFIACAESGFNHKTNYFL